MKDTIKLNEIAGYLPYELQMDISHTEYGRLEKKRLKSCKLTGIQEGIVLLQTNISQHNGGRLFLNFDVPKPLLLPLEYLTKKIEVNGKIVVPIYEMFKIQGFTVPSLEKCELSFKDKYETIATIKSDYWMFRYIKMYKSFWVNGLHPSNQKHQKCHHQLEIFEKMYEYHFDIHNLISRGLAIDKTKIQ